MHMPNRTAKFVSAIFASLLGSTPLTTISFSAAANCLSGPKDEAPEGSHWYYRIDHPSTRHCWYLRHEGEKLSQLSAKPAPSKAEPAVQRSVADAHAELPLPQMRIEQETGVAGQHTPATSANAVSPENNQLANSPDANARASVIASRWPEPLGVSSSAGPAPVAGNPGATMQPNSQATPSPVAAMVPLAAADSSSENLPRSILMLLIAVIGALSFAGLLGSTIFRFGGTRRVERPAVRGDRRAIWDSIVPDRPLSSAHPDSNPGMPRVAIPRDPRAADDPNRRVAEMLARLSRSAAN
jgi:hypothetical protein